MPGSGADPTLPSSAVVPHEIDTLPILVLLTEISLSSSPSSVHLPGRFYPQFLDKNRCDIGKSQSISTDSKMETPGSHPMPRQEVGAVRQYV
jgi:hypothetical protein